MPPSRSALTTERRTVAAAVVPSRPLVSVVMPMFNASLTIRRALESVQAQGYTHWETICVDDASTDDTVARVAALDDPRIRVIQLDHNSGPARARNLGIAAAKGAFVAFLDADDEWLPDKLARQVALFEADAGLALVVTDMRVKAVDGSDGSSIYARQAPAPGAEAWRTLLASSFIATSALMTRRALLDEVGGFDPDLVTGEDQDLFIRLAMAGRLHAIPEQLAIYHWMPRSYSTGHAARQAADVVAMVRRHLQRLGERLSPAERRSILGRRYERLGANLMDSGAYLRGAWLMLRAAGLGRAPLGNLVAIPRRILARAGKSR
ncbi:MAG: glycosyltransferase [Alphaproteobacteria bacterium]|nr:glycosyltransferase [Alphaproteobacteria bacterium]